MKRFILIIALGLLAQSQVGWSQIVVTSTADAGVGTLRQAITDVPNGGTITFAPNLTITLASELTINVAKSFTIDGSGTNAVISGNNVCRVFNITGQTGYSITINGLKIKNGKSSYGGGINAAMTNGTLLVKNCTISENASYSGGGGGIYATGGVFTNCIITGNTALHGGGIYIYNGAVTVTNCLIAGNTASNYGGGACASGGGSFTNCTITANTAGNGGGVFAQIGGIFSNCLFWNNTSSNGNDINILGTGMSFTYCAIKSLATVIWGSAANNNNQDLSVSPFNGTNEGKGTDNIWGTADDNYTLNNTANGGANCIHLGNNATNSTTTDISGNARIVEVIDIGASEYQYPAVTTQAVTNVIATTATGNGNITFLGTTKPTAHGVCWGANANPTTADNVVNKGAASSTGPFTASITGLSQGTLYHVRAYATNAIGTVYGADVTFTTPTQATVTTQAASAITATSATANGNITDLGLPNPTAYGVCWGTNANPAITDHVVNKGAASSAGPFTAAITGLSQGTLYHVRAYATNAAGTVYGEDITFTTPTLATVTTQAASAITATSATANGNITSLGLPNLTAYGICWGTNANPTTANNVINNGAASSTGPFTATITGLTPRTLYHVRAYATNAAGTVYGADVAFYTSLANGSGTQADPYQIATLADLQWLSQNMDAWNKYFIQTANIDASATSSWNGGAGFSPIGSSTNKFTGSYNGQGYTISKLYIYRTNDPYIGLFGCTSGSKIENASLVDCSIKGRAVVGSVVGYTLYKSIISNCYSTGSVSGNSYIGGLVGETYNSSTNNSYTTCKVSGDVYIGGLVGANDSQSTISNCYSKGSVSGNSNVGGLAGYNSYSTVNNSYYDTNTSGQTDDDGRGTPKTTSEMQSQNTYSGWDFAGETANGTADIWTIASSLNNGYPCFKWPTLATVTTQVATDITTTSVTANGNISGLGLPGPTAYGVCWGASANPTISDNVINNGAVTSTRPFSLAINGLAPATSYYVRAYATNAAGTSYGSVVSFTTQAIPATAVSISVPANDTYGIGKNLDFTVNFTDNIFVVQTGGTPRIALTIGSIVRYANYVSGSGTKALVFRYTVIAGDEDKDGITVGALSANGATIKNSGGSDALLTINGLPSTSGVLIDGIAPAVSISAASTTTYGTSVPVTITFTKPVTGFTADYVTVTNASKNNFSGSGTTYTVDINPASAGAVTIYVSSTLVIDAAGNYNIASSPINISVDKLKLLVKTIFYQYSKIYDGTTAATVFSTSLKNVVAGDDVSIQPEGSYNDASAATGKTITVAFPLTGTSAANYSAPDNYVIPDCEITPLKLTATNPSLTLSKAYDGSATASVTPGSITNKVTGDDVSLSAMASYNDASIATGKTITVAYSLSGASAANYTVPVDYTVNTGEIKPRKLTATNPSITLSKTYDGTATASVSAGSITNKVTGDVVSLAATASYNDATAATGKTITVAYSLIGASTANYSVPDDYIVTTAEITPLKLTAANPSITLSKAYDGSANASVTPGSITNKVTGDDVSLAATASYNDATAATGKTITVAYSLSGASALNYSVPDNYIVNTGEIKSLKLTATNPSISLSKAYDGSAIASVTPGSIINKVTGDDVSLSAMASYNDASIATGKIITVAYSLSGASTSNYAVPDNYVVNTGEITPLKLAVHNPSLVLSKSYDGTATASVTAGSIINKVTGDDVSLAATASYNDATAATGKTITVAYSLSGASISNYSVPDDYTVNTGEITPLKLTATNPSLTLSKTYDGSAAASVNPGALTNKVTDDDVLLAAVASYNDATAASGKTITVAYSLSGASASNYSVPDNYIVTTGEIKPLKLTITNPSLTLSKTYDGTTSASVIAGALTNIITGDDVSVTATASYKDKRAETGKTIGVTYNLSGSAASSYTAPDDYLVTTGAITRAPLTIALSAQNKPYDGNTLASVSASITQGLVNGDDVTVSASNGQFDNANIGQEKNVTADISLTGNDAANYTFNQTAVATASVLDDTKPMVTLTAAEVNGYIHTSSSIGITFSEPVNLIPSTLKEGLVLHEGNAAGPEVDYTTSGFSATGVSQFTITGDFDCGKSYYLAVKAGAFADLSGNAVQLTEKTLQTDAVPASPLIAVTAASVCPGTTMSVTNYNDKLSYQWQMNGTSVSGQTGDKYELPADGSGTYSVLAEDPATGCRSVSSQIPVEVYTVVTPLVYEKKDKDIVSLLIVDNSANTFTAYQWTLADGSPVPSGMVNNRQFLTVTAPDMNKQYVVQTTDKNGCIARSLLASVTATAASSLVYPTVNNGTFKIDVSSAESGKVSIRIMSQTGILIKQYLFYKEQGQATFDIHPGDMVAGKYLVEINTGNFRDVKNIVVE